MSSNGIGTRELVSALKSSIQAAFGEGCAVFVGRPRLQASLDYVVIELGDIDISMTGPGATVLSTSQRNSFNITKRTAFPEDPTLQVDLLKADDVNALIAQLQTGSTYSGLALQPVVNRVSFSESDDCPEGAYEFTVAFECITIADHH